MKGKSLFFFSIPVMIQGAVDQMLKQLLTLVLFSFLFHALANQVGLIAGDLTGGAPLSKMAGSATALFDKAASLTKAAIKSQMGDKEGAKKDAKEAGGDKGGKVSGDSGGGAARPGAGGGGDKGASVSGGK